METLEILYKNEKLTKRLLEIKETSEKLNFFEKLKKYFLKQYNIPYSELELIDAFLRQQDHIKPEHISSWTDEGGAVSYNYGDPIITEYGILALKKNYYEVHFILNKLIKLEPIPNIIMATIAIISIAFGVLSKCSDKRLKDENIRLSRECDSLKTVIKQITVPTIPIIATKNDTLKAHK
jgi:hypothetical protein